MNVRKLAWIDWLVVIVLGGNLVAETGPPEQARLIDLTHSFSADTIYWPTAQQFKLETEFRGHTEKGYFYSAHRYSASEHGGTHIDAPIHFAQGRQTLDQIPLERLTGPAVVIKVSAQSEADADYQISVTDLTEWEAQHGRLPDAVIVLFNTGYARHWPDAKRYLGTERRGEDAVAALHFPGLHPEAARWLVSERNINAVGLDTASIDYGQSTHFESHCILFEHNVPAFENVANLEQLPATGAYVVALPMKIEGGSGGPLRIIAWVPEN